MVFLWSTLTSIQLIKTRDSQWIQYRLDLFNWFYISFGYIFQFWIVQSGVYFSNSDSNYIFFIFRNTIFFKLSKYLVILNYYVIYKRVVLLANLLRKIWTTCNRSLTIIFGMFPQENLLSSGVEQNLPKIAPEIVLLCCTATGWLLQPTYRWGHYV